jgi:hypothetical protein
MHRPGDSLSGSPKRQFHTEIISQFRAEHPNRFATPADFAGISNDRRGAFFFRSISIT